MDLLSLFFWEFPTQFYSILLSKPEALHASDIVVYVCFLGTIAVIAKLVGILAAVVFVWGFPYILVVIFTTAAIIIELTLGPLPND